MVTIVIQDLVPDHLTAIVAVVAIAITLDQVLDHHLAALEAVLLTLVHQEDHSVVVEAVPEVEALEVEVDKLKSFDLI